MIIDCISDIHGEPPVLEGGDLLIIGGDLTASDRYQQYSDFMEWLEAQKYRKKILIAGNHDTKIQDGMDFDFPDLGIDYLQDSGIVFEGYRIWGSPWTKLFIGQNSECMAFGLHLDIQMKEKWDLIPVDTQILITHGPPRGVLDSTRNRKRVGCVELANRLVKLPELKLHVFGHIHEGYGQCYQACESETPLGPVTKNYGHLSVNASIMNVDYECVNKPIRVIL